MFYATKKQYLTQENVDVAKKKKVKPQKRNWISSNGSTKHRHKDQSYQSKNK